MSADCGTPPTPGAAASEVDPAGLLVRHRLVNVRGTQRTVAMPQHVDVVDPPHPDNHTYHRRSVTVVDRAEHLGVHR